MALVALWEALCFGSEFSDFFVCLGVEGLCFGGGRLTEL